MTKRKSYRQGAIAMLLLTVGGCVAGDLNLLRMGDNVKHQNADTSTRPNGEDERDDEGDWLENDPRWDRLK